MSSYKLLYDPTSCRACDYLWENVFDFSREAGVPLTPFASIGIFGFFLFSVSDILGKSRILTNIVSMFSESFLERFPDCATDNKELNEINQRLLIGYLQEAATVCTKVPGDGMVDLAKLTVQRAFPDNDPDAVTIFTLIYKAMDISNLFAKEHKNIEQEAILYPLNTTPPPVPPPAGKPQGRAERRNLVPAGIAVICVLAVILLALCYVLLM